jgi:hypothetical protein
MRGVGVRSRYFEFVSVTKLRYSAAEINSSHAKA